MHLSLKPAGAAKSRLSPSTGQGTGRIADVICSILEITKNRHEDWRVKKDRWKGVYSPQHTPNRSSTAGVYCMKNGWKGSEKVLIGIGWIQRSTQLAVFDSENLRISANTQLHITALLHDVWNERMVHQYQWQQHHFWNHQCCDHNSTNNTIQELI